MINENSELLEKYKPSSSLSIFISKYYYNFLGAALIIIAVFNYIFNLFPVEYNGFVLLAAFISFTVVSDIRSDVNTKNFLLKAIPFMILVFIIGINGNDLWHGVLRWELKRVTIFNMNSIFNSIPLNDASFARVFHPAWLTNYMKMVYNTGFVLAVLAPLVRSFLAYDFKKMIKYTLSAHVFQVFLITPFYMIFFVQEVWYVHGHADTLARHLKGAQILETTVNCFPSMHTSIAFAMFLLVLRERNKLFKWVWGFYCLSVIYSTMYLEIHWVIDVIGGLFLGYYTVKLVDLVVLKAEPTLTRFTSFIVEKLSRKVAYDEQ